jgi:hypothetical protein
MIIQRELHGTNTSLNETREATKIKNLQEKAVEATKQKKKRGKNLSPGKRKACHSVSTALLKSVAEIGTQRAMKSSKKTLHEFTSHIPQKTPKRNKTRSTNKMTPKLYMCTPEFSDNRRIIRVLEEMANPNFK